MISGVIAFIAVSQVQSFLLKQKGEEEVLKATLLQDLTSTFRRGHDEDRLLQFEAVMLPMFQSLPKNTKGNVGQATARRALHRFFHEHHGWSIEGLQPADDEGDSATPRSILTTWMPSYLVGAIEQLFGTDGVNLREMTVLAAAFEDLAHREAISRLEDLFDWFHLPTDTTLDEDRAFDVIKAYMIMYTSGGNTTVRTKEHLMMKKGALNKRTLSWLKKVQHQVAEAEAMCDTKGHCGQLDFKAATRVAEEIGEQYRSFNQGECEDLRTTLMRMEDQPGHVLLSDFYRPGLHNSWNFTEKEDYLRALGALKEVDGQPTSVLIPNYVYSRPNCLATSEVYVVCCKNLCEDLMSNLERKIAAPTATPYEVKQVLEELRGRSLPPGMVASLMGLSDQHDGQIPLHGTSFAHWLHEVFPQDCPRPHPEGRSHHHDPEVSVHVTLEGEMAQQANRTCGPDGSGCVHVPEFESSAQVQVSREVRPDAGDIAAPRSWFRTVAFVAFGLAVWVLRAKNRMTKSDKVMDSERPQQPISASWV